MARHNRDVALGSIATSIYSGLSMPPSDEARRADHPARSLVGRGTCPVQLVSYKHVRDGDVMAALDQSTTDDERRLAPYAVAPGDILVTARGSSLRIGEVPSTFPQAYLTTTLLGIRLGPGYLPSVLAHYLATPEGRQAVAALSSGVVNLSISPRALAELRVPSLSMERQQELSALLAAHKAARRAADLASHQLERIIAAISQQYLAEAQA